MLNLKVIDVDRLDYLIRDAYITGFKTVNLDYERLLSALTIVRAADAGKATHKIAYKKDALSVIEVSAKYSCGFPEPQVLPIIVVDRYLDYFTTIMEDRLWQVPAKPAFRWRNRSGLSMNDARAA